MDSLEDTSANRQFICDICYRTIESEGMVERHIDLRHKALMAETMGLLREQRPTTPATKDQLTAIGRKVFEVAAQRDAGPEMLEIATVARTQLQKIVSEWNPQAEVYIFGSTMVVGSWDGKSDIDFVVIDPKAHMAHEWPPEERRAVRDLSALLKLSGFSDNAIECVDHARVPIVKHHSLKKSRDAKSSVTDAARSVRLAFPGPKSDVSERARVEAQVKELVPEVESVHWLDHHVAVLCCESTSSAVGATLKLARHFKAEGARVGPSQQTNNVPEVHRIDFDLCLRNFGIRNSAWLHEYHVNNNNGALLRSGAVVLKTWAKLYGVNNSFLGFLTSYAVNILWINFLVQRKVVPYVSPRAISEDPTDAKRFPSYVPLTPKSCDDAQVLEMMGGLLVDFFVYYAFEFNWERDVVSLNREGTTTKAQLRWMPAEGTAKNVRYHCCIEDPYEPNLNLGRHMGICKTRKVKAEFVRASLSLMRDAVNHCVVFGGKDPIGSQRSGEGLLVSEPPPECVMKLSEVAGAVFHDAVSKTQHVTDEILRKSFEAQAPEALEVVSKHWPWRTVVRRLGYHLCGDILAKRVNLLGGSTPMVHPLPSLQTLPVATMGPAIAKTSMVDPFLKKAARMLRF